MNKLVYTALALTTVSASAFATDTGWVSLDQEINSLNASLSAQNATGPKVGGYIRARWENSSDDGAQVTDPLSGNPHDLSGFNVDNARVELSGDAGSDYSYKVSFEMKTGTAVLYDSYAKFKLGDMVTGKLGHFKANFLRSSTVADNKLVLLDRTELGHVGFWNTRDWGIEFCGAFDTIGWSISATNGSDLNGKEYKLCAKVSANLMGGGVGKVEGAYGAGDATALTAGLAFMDDSNIDKGTAIGGEVAVTAGPFSIHGEIVDFDKGDAGVFHETVFLNDPADTTPWDITASYLFTDQWEAAVRYEEADDADNTNQMTLGVNYFVAGHDIKWTLEWKKLTTDNAIGDISILGLGLSVSM